MHFKTAEAGNANLIVEVELPQNSSVDKNQTRSNSRELVADSSQYQEQLGQIVALVPENTWTCVNQPAPGFGLVLTGSLMIISILRYFR